MDRYTKKFNTITSTADFIDSLADVYGERVAFQMRRRIINEKIYYKDLPRLRDSIVQFLSKNNIQPNDKVLIWGLNCPEYALILLSFFSVGIIAVPVDMRTSQEVIAKIVKQTKAKAAFVSRFLPLHDIKSELKIIYYIEDIFNLIQPSQKKVNYLKLDPTKLAEIVYTSGTTGVPKGVMISQSNILANVKAIRERIPPLAAYRTLSILPLSHMFEQIIGLFLSLSYGSTITYLPRINSFTLRKAMKETRPTFLLFVPQMLQVFWQKIEEEAQKNNQYTTLMRLLEISKPLPRGLRKRIFSKIHTLFGGSLEFIGCGGAPLNYQLAKRFNTMGFKILEGYGATEVTAAASFNIDPQNLGTVGKPLDGVKITLTKDKEIMIKSPFVSLGYFENPEKTADVFLRDGYRTGDIGEIHTDGTLSIIGRDFFKIVLENGEKVYVEDIEKKINEHPDVKDSCVVGIRDRRSDKVHAVVILKQKVSANSLKKIIDEINTNLEPKQQIVSYQNWETQEFPRTSTLKLDRKLIQKVVAEGLATDSHPEKSLPSSANPVTLLDILAQVSKKDVSTIKDNDFLAADLGMNSIERGELVSSIEENLGIIVDMLEITPKTTVAELKKIVARSTVSTMKELYRMWQFTNWGEMIRRVVSKYLFFPVHSHFVKLKVINPENLKELQKPGIIIMNHVGLFDGICAFRLLGLTESSRLVTLAGSFFWKNTFFSRILEIGGGAIPLDQSGKNIIPLAQFCSDRLAEDRFMVLAPTGTMQRSAQPDRFKTGIGFFAQELRVPIIPIKLIGYEKIWPPPKTAAMDMKASDILPKSRGEVQIKIGKRLDLTHLESPAEIVRVLEDEFNKL